MKKQRGKLVIAFLLILTLVIGLIAFRQGRRKNEENQQISQSAAAGSPQEAGGETPEEAPEEAHPGTENPETEEPEPFGSPWVNSILSGNLPEEAPEVKDDLFLCYNYEQIAAHQGQLYVLMQANTGGIQQYLTQIMASDSLSSAANGICTEAELEQLSIFYQQAADLEALRKAGLSELQPYLDRIQSAQSLSDLNAVLVSDDFPFSPYLYLMVSTNDRKGVNNVFVFPELLLADNMEGAILYQDSDDEAENRAKEIMLSTPMIRVFGELKALGFGEEEAGKQLMALFNLERSYGKDSYYGYRYQDMEYGAHASSRDSMSLEELAALCPNYPVKETIEKFGKGGSPAYSVFEKKWLNTFNSVWTEENLEELKSLTMVKVIHECAPYLDPALFNRSREIMGLPPADAQENAATVCDQNATFAQLIAKLYIASHYTQEDIARLTDLTNDLIASFRGLIEQSSWVDDRSKERMILKLEEMQLCILFPDGGYQDYSDLTLTKSGDGGTLFGNYLKLKAWANEKINARIGQPGMDRLLWEHYPPDTVNCFYNPMANSINIMPGFTAAGMYRNDMSEEELAAKMGWAIAHEIGHGFDYTGSQMDAFGRGNSVFEEESLDQYLENINALTDYMDSIEVLPGVYAAGERWKTEAGADLIGMEIVMATVAERDGFDYEEFFKNTADLYAEVLPTTDYVYIFLLADGHPMNYLRVNVNVQMFDELYETYDIDDDDGMYLPEEQRIHFYGR